MTELWGGCCAPQPEVCAATFQLLSHSFPLLQAPSSRNPTVRVTEINIRLLHSEEYFHRLALQGENPSLHLLYYFLKCGTQPVGVSGAEQRRGECQPNATAAVSSGYWKEKSQENLQKAGSCETTCSWVLIHRCSTRLSEAVCQQLCTHTPLCRHAGKHTLSYSF